MMHVGDMCHDFILYSVGQIWLKVEERPSVAGSRRRSDLGLVTLVDRLLDSIPPIEGQISETQNGCTRSSGSGQERLQVVHAQSEPSPEQVPGASGSSARLIVTCEVACRARTKTCLMARSETPESECRCTHSRRRSLVKSVFTCGELQDWAGLDQRAADARDLLPFAPCNFCCSHPCRS